MDSYNMTHIQVRKNQLRRQIMQALERGFYTSRSHPYLTAQKALRKLSEVELDALCVLINNPATK